MFDRNRRLNLSIAGRAAFSTLGRRFRRRAVAPTDIFLAIMDHFEPSHRQPSRETALARLQDWIDIYPRVASCHRDFDGRIPAHGFFYPWDEYDETEFARLSRLCADGFGEIELHLHHRDDTSDSLREKLGEGLSVYRSHGALSQWSDGRPAFGFIHGNWALDNSRSENGRNYCGVNDELAILEEMGCYADFTFPSWQMLSQPRTLNSIYYAEDNLARPKSYDYGVPARVGASHRGLLMVQGPLTPYVDRSDGRFRLAMDDGDLAVSRRYHPFRLDRWVSLGISVAGRPDRIFIKLHCHGAADKNRTLLLNEDLDKLFTDAEARYNDGERFRLHYVTAREMYNIVRATEEGSEDLSKARDWVLPRSAPIAAAPVTRVSAG